MYFSITGILSLWQIQSAHVTAGLSVSSIFILYVIVCLMIKRPVFLLAFLLPELMFNLSVFDNFEEWHLNAIELVIYSYIFERCLTKKSKLACFAICYTAFIFGVDSFLYGVNGIYGENQTLIYENISLINSCAHIFLISTLIPIERIRDGLRDFVSGIVRFTATSDYVFIYCYNISKIQQPEKIK